MDGILTSADMRLHQISISKNRVRLNCHKTTTRVQTLYVSILITFCPFTSDYRRCQYECDYFGGLSETKARMILNMFFFKYQEFKINKNAKKCSI